MATDQTNEGGLTYLAGSDLSASQFCAVKQNTSTGRLELPSAGGRITGVLYSKPTAAGLAATVMPPGRKTKIKAGGSFDAGAELKVTAAGKFVAASAGERVVAVADIASTGDGQIVTATLVANGEISEVGMSTLTGAGEIEVTSPVATLVATSDAVTMPDGLYVGQEITVILGTGSTGSNTFTPDTVSADTAGGTSPAAVTYTTIGQWTKWRWLADGWKLIAIGQGGVGAVTAAGTVNLLHTSNQATIDGTDTITVPDGYFVGQQLHVIIIAAANTPIMVLSGKFYDEDGSADAITVTTTSAAAGNLVAATWNGARWSQVNYTGTVAFAP